jgi:hypothetical protein
VTVLEAPPVVAQRAVTWPPPSSPWQQTPAAVEVLIAPPTPEAVWGRGQWGHAHWGGWAWSAPIRLEYGTEGLVIERGRSDPLDHIRAGAFAATVQDPHGKLTPWAIPADGLRRARTGVPVRVQSSGGVLFTGVLTVLDQNETTDPAELRMVQLEGADPLRYLAGSNGLAQGDQGAGELAGARIARVIANAGVPSWVARTMDIGQAPMQSTTLAGDALTEIWLTADSDAGMFSADRDGTLHYRSANVGLAAPAYIQPQWLFTDDDDYQSPIPLVCCTRFSVRDDEAQVINTISVAAKDGTAQVATDSTSRAWYGAKTTQRHDLIHAAGDPWSLAVANLMLERVTRQSVVISPIVFDALRDDNAWRCAHALEPGHRVALHRTRDENRLDLTAAVDQVRHDITPAQWTVTVTLSPGTQRTSYSRWGHARWGHDVWS